MADETTTTTTETLPPSTETKQPDPSKAETPPGRIYTDAEVNDFLAKNKRQWQDSEEMKGLRQKAKQLDDLTAAQKTAEERLATERDTEKGRADTYATKYRQALIKDAFTRAAITKGIPADRIDAAFRLIDSALITVNEETDVVTGADKAVESLPVWLATAPTGKPPAPDISAGANGQNQPDPVAREADLRRRFRLNP